MTAQNNSIYGSRLITLLPFLRQRYGRPLFYLIFATLFLVFFEQQSLSQIALMSLIFCGTGFGVIAMQPNNPLDYRGFTRSTD
mmetsp:Transcript_9643/g.16196  ORF Transcript_9643/g.16196 Transcript_9643/m.16196 type:complete len:83 (+) Transcript_9643:246-494(+)